MKAKKNQKGVAIAYMLTAIALLGLISFALSRLTTSSKQLEASFETRLALIGQYQMIRSRILSCGIAYPAGDNGTGSRVRYPATPLSERVLDLECPGKPGANNLWNGSGGVRLSAPPPAFSEWGYVNDATSMRLSIEPMTTGDTSSLSILSGVAIRVGDNASMVGNALVITLMN